MGAKKVGRPRKARTRQGRVPSGVFGTHFRCARSLYSPTFLELDFIHLVRKRVGYDHRQSATER